MNQNILHVGLDVEDTQYHGSAFNNRSNRIGKDVKARRNETPPDPIRIADRCRQRLNKKGNSLLLAGKHPNKVKVACARERWALSGNHLTPWRPEPGTAQL